jgi:hypothetical protein
MRRITSKRALAAAVLEVVLAEEHYDQRLWISSGFFDRETVQGDMEATGTELRKVMSLNVCGTTSCVAGTAIILTLPAKGKYDYAYDEVVNPDGSRSYAQPYAQRALGLTDPEADWLFNGQRTRTEVVAALSLLAAGKGIANLVPSDEW